MIVNELKGVLAKVLTAMKQAATEVIKGNGRSRTPRLKGAWKEANGSRRAKRNLKRINNFATLSDN